MQIDDHLAPGPANYRPLSPVDFLDTAAHSWPDRTAVIWRGSSWTYAELARIVSRLAALLEERGIGKGDVVSVMCPNRPEMLAAHYAVPIIGAVLNGVNTRLDASAVSYILTHSESRLIIADPTSAETATKAAENAGTPVLILSEDGTGADGLALLSGAAPEPLRSSSVADEWQPIALNYTSGTTGDPKGVVLHHRGAYLNALGNVMAMGFNARTRYLWTLPMFHCNGWCHTWAVTAAGGVHICLDRVEPSAILNAIRDHDVTHMSCAPVVLYTLLNDPAMGQHERTPVTVATGGAAPTAALIRQMDEAGFDFLHLYGLTEVFGPATLCVLEGEQQNAPVAERAGILARQGRRHTTAAHVRVLDDAGRDVVQDGRTVGEIVLAGHTVMAGYYRDAEATARALNGDGFHTGDLAVVHPDGQIQIRDRAKDIIISGGENISSLEVESALHLHPAVLMAAVVAAPDDKWGEIPFAFVELRSGHEASIEDLQAHCRQHLAGFKIPRRIQFGELPRTATGKIQKFQLREAARKGTEDA